jgi:glutathione peroxidase
MKILTVLLALLFVSPSSVYEFKLKDIDGKAFSLAKYKGKKILVVNTASGNAAIPNNMPTCKN